MKTFITAVALTLASFTSLAASVSFPESLDITGVNGQTKFNNHQVQLNQGKNLIELKYYDTFEVNADDSGAWVKSQPLYLLMTSNNQEQYRAFTPDIESEEEAYEFINNPVITLTNTAGMEKEIALLTHHQLMAQLLFAKQ
ncbi:DUF2057 domain-containing protein [Shewanella sp. D64]|uniref:DUF2057 family protein n=1 Tax=unclassified Shewanella TaxID=196818 RepID=UPI0022BA1A2E|nr:MULTISPECIES: DUF2057 family protein [unclassified Shewanella]MEC4727938.1 DUF2057 domain-containing protein [Shewanella sp. D64]MEC4740090.1 DUF2057 domain-containing protein [Shewanella sp. E94]WBJ95859.1 DUF2057 domain-containing protein [Shewanella sp. MTB7]